MENTTQEINKDYYTNIKVFVGNTLIIDSEKYNVKEKEEEKKDKYQKDLTHIREILSKALQIDNLNFLLGAGCSSYVTTPLNCKKCQNNYNFQCDKFIADSSSYDCGIPIMRGLIQNFKIMEKDMEIVGLKLNDEMLKEVFKNNLENILEYLQSLYLVTHKISNKQYIYYKKNDTENNKENYIDIKSNDIQTSINKIKNFIIREILKHKDTQIVIELYKSFYQKIINKNRKNPINIFTTNYDVYNETALDRLNFLYNNGFSGTVERKFNPMLYKYRACEKKSVNSANLSFL